MHVPGGRARVRLVVTGGRSCDAVIAGRRLRLRDAERERRAGLRAERQPRHLAEDRRRRARRHGRVPRRAAPDPRQPSRGRGLPRGHERLPGAGAARVRHGAHARIRARSRYSPPAPAPRRSSACTGSAGRRPPSSPPSPRWPTAIASSRSTCRDSASPTSRSARPTTRPGSPAPHSPRWTRSASSGRTSPATAWADGWRSRPGSWTPTAPPGCCC